MNKLLTALLLTISVSASAACSTYDGWDSSYCDVPVTPPGYTQSPNTHYDVYRNGNNTTYQPKESYKGSYGYDLERYGKPITCTTIGRNTFCN